MDPVLLTTFGTLIVLLIFTVPIGVSIGTAVFMGMMVGGLPPVFLAQKMYSALASFPLLAVPFFIVAGDIMQKGTIANSLLAVSRCLVGHIKGGMAHISILTSLFYGALSGSAAATVAAVGGIMIPAMEKEGYPKEFATAVNSTSGCLGIMIPPSIPLILFGSTAGVSISDLFVATIVPGILMGCALMLVSYVICVRRKYGKTVARAKFAEMLKALYEAKWAIMVPVIVLGGIYGGITTPTEAGAIAVVYALFVEVFITRSMTRKLFFEIIKSSVRINAAIFLVVASATALGQIMMYYNLSAAVLDTIMSISTSKVVIMALILIVLLILGTFLEAAAIIMIVTPLLLPVINAIGVDPVHFGIIMLTSFAVGGQTPPVGMTLFVGASIAKISIERLSIASIPYILTLVVMLFIIAFVPQLSLCLISVLNVGKPFSQTVWRISMKLFKAMLCSVAALSLLLPAAHAQAAPTVVKIALTQPTGHPTTDLIRGQFKKTIEEKTNGRFRIDVFDNYSFGNFEAVVQGLQFGMLQFAQESPSNLSIYDPKLMIFDLPYLMPDYDAVNILLDGKVGKELSRSLEKIGIKGMGWIALGTRFYWMNKPFHTMAEAKSMKIRATASKVHISMTKAFGMNPTPMAWSETFTALQQGTVAGVDVDIHSAVSANLHEVAPHLVLSGHFYTPHLFMASAKFMDSLSPEDRKIFEETFAEVQKIQRSAIHTGEQKLIEKLRAQGVDVIEFSPEARAEFMNAGKAIWKDFDKQVPPSLIQQVLDGYKAAGKNY